MKNQNDNMKKQGDKMKNQNDKAKKQNGNMKKQGDKMKNQSGKAKKQNGNIGNSPKVLIFSFQLTSFFNSKIQLNPEGLTNSIENIKVVSNKKKASLF
jgi:hypothetical protein